MFTMRNEEFQIVRDLMSGRDPASATPVTSAHSLAPTSFREIDGHELARQYVAHRKLRESEALARQREAGELPSEAAIMGVLRGERRVSAPIDPYSARDSSGNWWSSIARSLWRR
jgi:hypothetical protein